MKNGQITRLSGGDFTLSFDERNPIFSHLIANGWQAIDPDDPHWEELARQYLSVPYLYTGEVTRFERDASYGREVLHFEIAYAGGTGARLAIQAANGQLTYYERLK